MTKVKVYIKINYPSYLNNRNHKCNATKQSQTICVCLYGTLATQITLAKNPIQCGVIYLL
ncbi:hypothetical protein MOUN0_N07800 [Monosporozyma unispora]